MKDTQRSVSGDGSKVTGRVAPGTGIGGAGVGVAVQGRMRDRTAIHVRQSAARVCGIKRSARGTSKFKVLAGNHRRGRR